MGNAALYVCWGGGGHNLILAHGSLPLFDHPDHFVTVTLLLLSFLTGVVKDGLTHPSIPDGWRWNGLVSDHCPVWAEFYCDRDFDRDTGHVTVDDITIVGKQSED